MKTVLSNENAKPLMTDDAERESFVEFINKIHLKQIEIQIPSEISEVYINNPPHNYLSAEVLDEFMMSHQMMALADRAGKFKIRGIIISGKGRKAFCAGASLDMLGTLKDPRDQAEIRRRGDETMRTMRTNIIPSIAAINGVCLGAGLELALSCHYRIAGKGVFLGFPEIHLGLIPGAGGTQMLPKLIGRSKAQYLILSGKLITADEALEMGLVDMVVDRKKVMSTAREIAREMCLKDQKATEYAMQAINRGLDWPEEEDLKYENALFWELVNDLQEKEGLSNDKAKLNITGKKKN